MKTLYARCEFARATPEVLIIRDENDELFGIFVGEGIRPSRGQGYYGSGEAFMFKYTPKNELLRVWKWTGYNGYVALCEPDFLSFGGGDGRYGIWVDEGLLEGSSAPCPTFGNDVLCSPGRVKAGATEFECVGLEVWKVGV